jgi:cell division protein FtsB
MRKNFLYHFVKKYHIKKTLFVSYFIALSIIFYFGFFIFFGEKGLLRLFALKQQIENKEAVKQEIFAKMQAKKNMVGGMNLESLDLDLLDEQARKVLGYAGKNEVVIYQENDPAKTGVATNQEK